MATLNEIIQQLTQAASQVRQFEADAKKALYSHNDKDLYYQLMSQKAHLLASLPESIAAMTTLLNSEIAQSLKSQIGAFSFAAKKAINLDSVFYMSALLYPDDYADGEANDLENFISQLENIR